MKIRNVFKNFSFEIGKFLFKIISFLQCRYYIIFTQLTQLTHKLITCAFGNKVYKIFENVIFINNIVMNIKTNLFCTEFHCHEY